MPLPDLIEIVPLTEPVRAEITVPGSKSITNRALILAALADGKVTLQGALWSEDTQVMVDCLQKLGFDVSVEQDPDEACNRTITVQGLGGRIPHAGTTEKPLELFVGNAGTAARFLAAMVCLGNGVYRLHGVPRMHERPQAALFQALRQLGYRVDSANDKLPAVIHGQSRNSEPGTRNCTVSIAESSQFASALLLCAKTGGWLVKVEGENADESPYVEMTKRLIDVFPWQGGSFQSEPDASSGSYFWAAAWLLDVEALRKVFSKISLSASRPASSVPKLHGVAFQLEPGKYYRGARLADENVSPLRVKDWPKSGWQIDAEFPDFVPLPDEISREGQLGDSIMMSIVMAADFLAAQYAGERVKWLRFTDLGRLRVQECERVKALQTELSRCGAHVVEKGDTLEVWPTELHGAEIETYNDHRMAMCFAILGLKVPGIKIKNPACVKKTFPNFFQKLAAPPPRGLGATILDGRTGRKLEMEELFAD